MNPQCFLFEDRDGDPQCFLFEHRGDRVLLHISVMSTLDALKLFDRQLDAKITIFGASHNGGWLGVNNLPVMSTVGDICDFLHRNNELGDRTLMDYFDLIDFSAELSNVGTVSTHDDSETNLLLIDESRPAEVINKLLSPSAAKDVLMKLYANPGAYVAMDEQETWNIFKSFDDLLAFEAKIEEAKT